MNLYLYLKHMFKLFEMKQYPKTCLPIEIVSQSQHLSVISDRVKSK